MKTKKNHYLWVKEIKKYVKISKKTCTELLSEELIKIYKEGVYVIFYKPIKEGKED